METLTEATMHISELEALALVPTETVPSSGRARPGESRAWAASGNVD